MKELSVCKLCPRRCGIERSLSAKDEKTGFCGYGRNPVIARAGLHMWEEPCISGERGSGAVFFSGCPLRCIFCQNHEISASGVGKEITARRLREIYFELIAKGAHNINLVTPTHFTEAVIESLDGGLPVPVVYNCGGYENVETLRMLEGKIQIYLPDLKYSSEELAKKYSAAPDYPETALKAIKEMYRQTGDYVLDDDGMLVSGVVIRHLVLPGQLENTFGVIDTVRKNFGEGVLFSLMSQYTPRDGLTGCGELERRLLPEEYEAAQKYLFASGIEDGFMQELSSAEKEYIPDFDLTGV